jgi:hypothetical protein
MENALNNLGVVLLSVVLSGLDCSASLMFAMQCSATGGPEVNLIIFMWESQHN